MKLALAGCALAWITLALGLTLAVCYARGRRAPRWLLWAHPLGACAAVVCLWVAVALWPGTINYLFNAGAFVVTLAFVAGGLLFALRLSGNRPPMIVMSSHGAVALLGCLLLTAGLCG